MNDERWPPTRRYAPAALTLAALALGLRDTAFFAGARDALRRADAAHSLPGADLLLPRGRLERAAGEADSATAVFARAGADSGSAASLARLELARTRFAIGAPGGDSAYYDGAATDDAAVVAAYRADLAPIASDSELARFDASGGGDRAAFLRRFWTDRDHVELRPDGERIREHYRRLLYARRHFALTIARRHYGDDDAYRSGSEELDDRGVIYVRHGEPVTRLKPFVFGLMPNETWRYGRADGDLLFHFSAGYDDRGGGDLYDYRLVESVLDLRGAGDAPKDQLLLSRQSLSPMYGRMLNWGPYGAAQARDRERGIGRASIDYGTSTDSYELQYARPLTAYADLVAVAHATGCRSRTSCSPSRRRRRHRRRPLRARPTRCGSGWSRSTPRTTRSRGPTRRSTSISPGRCGGASTSSGAPSSRCRRGTGAGGRRSSSATRRASSCRGTACASRRWGPRSPSVTWPSASGRRARAGCRHPPTRCC